MKKLYPIIFIALIVFVCTSCQYVPSIGTNQSPTTTEEVTVDPVILDVYVAANGKQFDRTIDDYIDPESIELLFEFYGMYDKNQNLYRLIYQDVLNDYMVESNKMTDSKQSIPLKMAESGLLVDHAAFVKRLGLVTNRSDLLRITYQDGVKLNTATLTGTAYSDYTHTQPKEFDQKEVSIVNTAGGYALIIADDKPYLTSEANLTNIKQNITPYLQTNEGTATDRKIVFAWDLFGNDETLKLSDRVDVVIPKWLSLQNTQGDINDLFRPQYTANIKKQGAQLWALVNNAFDPDLTSEFLKSTKARDNFTTQMINYITSNGVSGISLDFENMYLKDSDLYVQLSAELGLKAKQAGVPLSIAVTVPDGSDNWSKVYDRVRLGKIADYMMLMAYDQYYAASKVAGPVAGYRWVDENIKKSLNYIPREKLVLGVPFYTRIWYERPSIKAPNQMNVKSKDVFMSTAYNMVMDNSLTPVWDEDNQQNYYAMVKDDAVQKFWYEGPVSASIKTGLINDHNLPGVAYWSLGFETEGAWTKIIEKIGE